MKPLSRQNLYSPKIISNNLAKVEEVWAAQIPGFKLREYSFPEVEEACLRIAGGETSPELERFVLNELVYSGVSFPYWADRYCYVHADEGQVRKIQIWPSQRMFLEKIAEKEERDPRSHVYIAALKGRQMGITTISQMVISHRLFLNKGTRALAASNVESKTFDLYLFMDRIYSNLPNWMQPGLADKVKTKHMVFPKLETKVNYAWSNQVDPIGQGQTLDMVHLTEVSTWTNPGYISGDIEPAWNSSKAYLPIFIAESTGNGAKGNYFADLYLGAKKEPGRVIPVFLSPFDIPDKYSESAEGIEFKPSTQQVAERWKREGGAELTKEQKAWYQLTRQRYESTGELEMFLQEYPTCEEEAFQTGMKSVFSLELRTSLRDQVKSPEAIFDVNFSTGKLRYADDTKTHFNKLVVWSLPEKGQIYVVGVDGSWGLGGDNDNAAISVIRVGTKERPDEQVAEFFGDVGPSQLANIVYTLGHLYEDKVESLPAMVACEAQPGSPSAITQEDLIKKGYPHFYTWKKWARRPGEGETTVLGWYTTAQSRPALTQAGVDAIKSQDLWVNSPQILSEMGTYVAHEKRFGLTNLKHLAHASGYHDDCLTALFIAFYTAHERDLTIVADERKKFASLPEEQKVNKYDPEYVRNHDVGLPFSDYYGERWGDMW